MKKMVKNLSILAGAVIICAVTVRLLTGGETLADYAGNQPEVSDAIPSPTVSPLTHSYVSPSPIAELSADLDDRSQFFTPDKETRTTPPPAATSPSVSDGRVTVQPGFYKEPLSDALIAHITGTSYPISAEEAEAQAGQGDAFVWVNVTENIDTLSVTYSELRHLNILYYDFNNEVQEGELICNQSIADDLLAIFYELYQNKYQIERIRLIEEYNGDDTLSMLDNNTSAFNYRVVEGTSNLSRHALGRAIDINPFYNPYVVFQEDGTTYISPEGSEIYADRSQDFDHKIDENDLCYQLFKQYGFTWGGDWNTMKDYQHFQK